MVPINSLIPPGVYVTVLFQPGFVFELGEGWTASEIEGVLGLSMLPAEGRPDFDYDAAVVPHVSFINLDALLGLGSPAKVYDPTAETEDLENPAGDVLEDVPDDFLGWLVAHPRLESAAPQAINVGGLDAMSVDSIVVDPNLVPSCPEDVPYECISSVPILDLGTAGAVSYAEGNSQRTIALDVGGDQVLIEIQAPSDQFEAFATEAQGVLESIQFPQ